CWCLVFVGMERGFLDSGDKKKKKEGVSSMPSDEFPILSGIAKNVKNIEGKINVPKSILKKAVRNIVNDTHEDVAAKVKNRYENSIMHFFLGKDPSYPVVQQYVSNTWRKFGFERITRNDDGVYLFKFAT
nr:hypothetical protein [Tanacetum cinerariifolium]